MFVQQAQVVEVTGERVTLAAAVKNTCNSCSAQASCGTGSIAKVFAGKTQLLEVKTSLPLRPGDIVTVGVPETSVLLASALLYLLPLVIFILSALSGHWLFQVDGNTEEWQVLAFAATITLISLVFLSRRSKQWDKRKFEPVILHNLLSKSE